PVVPLLVPVNIRKLSRIIAFLLRDSGFVVEDGVAGPDRDTPKRRDRLPVELLDPQQNVSLVHGLEVEVSSNNTVGVDNRTAHVCPDFWSIRSLDGCSSSRSGG